MDIAQQMLDTLDEGTWGQGHYEQEIRESLFFSLLTRRYVHAEDRHYTRCLLGAYGELIGSYGATKAEEDDPYLALLARIITEQYPERLAGVRFCHARSVIARFNDHDDTRYPDIRMILEKAAAG